MGGIEAALDKAESDIKQGEHIVVEWIDALRYDELCKMPWLQHKCKEGMFFEKMYACCPQTRATAVSMATGERYIEGRIFDYTPQKCTKSKLYFCLRDKGYSIYCASTAIYKEWIINSEEEHLMFIYDKYNRVPSTIQYFLTLNKLQSGKRVFSIIHTLSETHTPMWCPEGAMFIMCSPDLSYLRGEEKEEAEKQIDDSFRYMDEQIRFYDRFINNAMMHIIMSDHGMVKWESDFSIEARHHIVFSILADSISPRKVIQPSTVLSFSDYIEAFLNGDSEFIDIQSDDIEVSVQNDDPYSKRIFELDDSKKNLIQWLQYRGVVTNRGFYVLSATGKEFFFEGSDEVNKIESMNEIGLKSIRKRVGNTFIDIYKEEKYCETRELYDMCDIVRADENIYIVSCNDSSISM